MPDEILQHDLKILTYAVSDSQRVSESVRERETYRDAMNSVDAYMLSMCHWSDRSGGRGYFKSFLELTLLILKFLE